MRSFNLKILIQYKKTEIKRMEIKAFVLKRKELYSTLLHFIDTPGDYQDEFQSLIQVFENQDILQNHGETLNLFHLMSKIEENHNRTPNFYEKFEQIFNYIINDNKFQIANSEIFQIYKDSKRLLLLLLEKNFIIPDDSILNQIFQMKDLNGYKYSAYLYSGIKPYINESKQQEIEKNISSFDVDIDTFIKKCQIGENDSPVCSLIREDSIEDFKAYVNQTKLPLSTKIERSIFETNSFLISIGKKPSLIEYAAFYGSIQIMQYLKDNGCKLKEKLWFFSIHSNNSEAIQFCEENQLDSKFDDYENLIRHSKWYVPEYRTEDKKNLIILREAVKCHHNDIYNNIKNNLISQNSEEKYKDVFESYIVDLYNYNFYPDDISDLISQKKSIHGYSISFLCSSFSTITIPISVTKIGKGAFYGCSNLKEIVIPSTVEKIGKDAFVDCKSLIEMIIPNSVVKIGSKAFKGCIKLNKIEIPSSVTTIGNNCFECCSSLVEVEIPENVSLIGDSVFRGCSSLDKILIPISVKSIGDFCFANCLALKEIQIPDSVESIGMRAFDGCSSLLKIEIPSSVASINDYTLNGCSSLNQIEFSENSSVNRIGDFAFYCCSSLEFVLIPSSVKEVGKKAFAECSALKKIHVPQSVTYVGVDAFPSWTKITNT